MRDADRRARRRPGPHPPGVDAPDRHPRRPRHLRARPPRADRHAGRVRRSQATFPTAGTYLRSTPSSAARADEPTSWTTHDVTVAGARRPPQPVPARGCPRRATGDGVRVSLDGRRPRRRHQRPHPDFAHRRRRPGQPGQRPAALPRRGRPRRGDARRRRDVRPRARRDQRRPRPPGLRPARAPRSVPSSTCTSGSTGPAPTGCGRSSGSPTAPSSPPRSSSTPSCPTAPRQRSQHPTPPTDATAARRRVGDTVMNTPTRSTDQHTKPLRVPGNADLRGRRSGHRCREPNRRHRLSRRHPGECLFLRRPPSPVGCWV